MTRDSAALRPRWYKTTTAPIDHIVEREKAAVKEQAKVLAKTEHAQQEQERRIQLKMRHMKMQLSSQLGIENAIMNAVHGHLCPK